MKCPVCSESMEVNNVLSAHDKVNLICYCRSCDVNADIVVDPERVLDALKKIAIRFADEMIEKDIKGEPKEKPVGLLSMQDHAGRG